MSSFPKAIFQDAPAAIYGRIKRSPLGTRTLGAWAAVVVARLKELAPYAMIELLLPGGSVLAVTLWFYRRRKKALKLANV